MVRIVWHGHACFEVVSKEGTVIGFDPHDGSSLGLKPPSFKADIVLVSHEHFDHNVASQIAKPTSKVYSMLEGSERVGGVEIVGLPSYHDKARGAQRGKNVIYKVSVDDLTVVHLGDLGDMPEDTVINAIRGCSVLFLPVGGKFTIEPEEAVELVDRVAPKLVVPMHYRVPGCTLPIKEVDHFVRLARWPVERVGVNAFEVYSESLPGETRVKVLSPP